MEIFGEMVIFKLYKRILEKLIIHYNLRFETIQVGHVWIGSHFVGSLSNARHFHPIERL